MINIICASDIIDGVSDSVSLMQEVATWLTEIDRPMWNLDELSVQAILQKYKKEEIYIGLIGQELCLTFVLQDQDLIFWPDCQGDDSFYIHKLSVARKFKGQGFGVFAIKWCKEQSLLKGKKYLRLDCDPNRDRLMDFYNNCGFRQVGRRFVGPYDTAFLEIVINPEKSIIID